MIAILGVILIFGYIVGKFVLAQYEFFSFVFICLIAVAIFAYLQIRVDKNKIIEVSNEISVKKQKIYKLCRDLNNKRKSEICLVLQKAAIELAVSLDFPVYFVRANLFVMNKKGKLKILKECCHNMKYFKELELLISEDEGCTGKCFNSGRIQVAVKISKSQNEWGHQVLKNSNMELINPDLKWIVSVPIMDKDRNVLCVMNIDGIKDDAEKMKVEEFSREILPRYAELIYHIVVG